MRYSFEEHLHRFAVWTAARAVQRNFTTTAIILEAIEKTSLRSLIKKCDINTEDKFDKFHQQTCEILENFFISKGIKNSSYGRAAKIVAIYIKTAIIIKEQGEGTLSKIAHPPIDRILLSNLHEKHKHLGFNKYTWTELKKDGYFELIEKLRTIQTGSFWMIEENWQPNQEKSPN